MRKITALQILVFNALAVPAILAGICTAAWTLGRLPLGDFRGVAMTLGGVVFTYGWLIVVYRLFIGFWPIRPGEIAPGSRQEFVYHVYLLFFLIFFYPVMRSGLLPTPLMRTFYLAIGTRLGRNTYTQGIIHDPPFVEIGNDSTVGQSALLVPHVIEGAKLAHYPIRIGNNVTVGANSVVLSDVEIGDGGLVATGAVVPKGSRIGPGEIWGGVPAKRIGIAKN